MGSKCFCTKEREAKTSVPWSKNVKFCLFLKLFKECLGQGTVVVVLKLWKVLSPCNVCYNWNYSIQCNSVWDLSFTFFWVSIYVHVFPLKYEKKGSNYTTNSSLFGLFTSPFLKRKGVHLAGDCCHSLHHDRLKKVWQCHTAKQFVETMASPKSM